jgi:hypothetical protein
MPKNGTNNEPEGRADNQPDARWMTFKELAAIRGISKLSAVALVRRRGWRRQRDNQGHVRALVPLIWLSGGIADQGDNQPHSPPHNDAYTEPFAAALAAIREAKDGEIATLREQLEQERARCERAEMRISGLEAGNATLQADLEAAREAVRRAEAALDGYYAAEAERRGRGRLARLRAAWRGE